MCEPPSKQYQLAFAETICLGWRLCCCTASHPQKTSGMFELAFHTQRSLPDYTKEHVSLERIWARTRAENHVDGFTAASAKGSAVHHRSWMNLCLLSPPPPLWQGLLNCEIQTSFSKCSQSPWREFSHNRITTGAVLKAQRLSFSVTVWNVDMTRVQWILGIVWIVGHVCSVTCGLVFLCGREPFSWSKAWSIVIWGEGWAWERL